MHALDGRRTRYSFWAKGVAAGALVVLADQFFYGHRLGSTVGAFALAWGAGVAVFRPDLRRDRSAMLALAAAFALSLALLDRLTLVGGGLFWGALTTAVLLPRTGPFADVGALLRRLATHAVASLAQPLADLTRLRRFARGGGAPRWKSVLTTAVLPVGGGLVFLALFAAANPLIQRALDTLTLPDLGPWPPMRVLFWIATFACVWAALRPARRWLAARTGGARPPRTAATISLSPSVASAVWALVVFNALFALENGLDIAFLWGGAGLPEGMTLAEYVHRGAYPLVGTALLAGSFSLALMREGSATGARPAIRGMVALWVAQNVFLVASSILRTLDYVGVYSLTRFRIAALLWMGLVALGLALIGWRMWRRKSGRWLVNANAAAMAAVLAGVSVFDIGEVAAFWNVTHAGDVGGSGAALDLCYLSSLGPSAVRPLLALDHSRPSADLRERASRVRQDLVAKLGERQADWRGWTWRGARRLEAARDAGATAPGEAAGHFCDGSLLKPPVGSISSPVATLPPGALPAAGQP